MKILIATFWITKFGGIVEYMHSMIQAFNDLGHEVDVIELKPTQISQSQYDRKFKEIESGAYQKKIVSHSQSGGYCKDETSGYFYI